MSKYIDIENLDISNYVETWDCICSENGKQKVMAIDDLEYLPTVDAVSKSAFEQVMWERDVALRQLREDYGVGLGEKKRDIAEVKHGEWIHDENYESWADMYICSACNHHALTDGDYRHTLSNYCPNCGAKMDN